MIGVVLWSDPADGKAVFWCEDQGDLAYYEAKASALDGYAFFDAGDMVQFDVTTQERVRKAHNASLVEEQAYLGLPESLRQNGSPNDVGTPSAARKSAQIIPFSGQSEEQERRLTRTLKA